MTNNNFKTFMAERARCWTSSMVCRNGCIAVPENPVHVSPPSAGQNGSKGEEAEGWGFGDQTNYHPESTWCFTFSCGDTCASENIFPQVYTDVLDWMFHEVVKDGRAYKNPKMEVITIPDADFETSEGHDLVDEPSVDTGVAVNNQQHSPIEIALCDQPAIRDFAEDQSRPAEKEVSQLQLPDPAEALPADASFRPDELSGRMTWMTLGGDGSAQKKGDGEWTQPESPR
jgi:hypothetical protein